MKPHSSFALAFVLLASGLSRAEDQAKMNIEDRKQSVAALAERIADREARLTEIANDIIRLDERLDTKVGKVVKRLTSIKDSTKSGFRVSQIKMEAIEGLAKTVERYQYKRAEVVREIREGRSGIPKEVLEGDAEHFDEHIHTRIEQIMKISKSFTQEADIKKFEEIQGRSHTVGFGWSDEVSRISDEWRQNRRDRTMNKKQRTEVIGALKKSIERYKLLISGQRDSLKNRRMSKAERDLMQAEMNRNIRILDERQGQLEEMLVVDQPKTAPVTRDAAHELQEALREASADMWEDMDTIFLRYTHMNRERARVFKLKKTLEAGRKWIADYEAKEKE